MGMASSWGGVGLEIPVSWRRLFNWGERRVKASGMGMTPKAEEPFFPSLEDKLPRSRKVSFSRSAN